MFILERCKREGYIKAWNEMYLSEKDKFNKNSIFDGINPSLNKTPLGTETDNFCNVAYDSSVMNDPDLAELYTKKGFPYGKPVGIFSFVVTPRKIIGKQFVVHPDYQGKGLGKALLIENEKTLKENGYEKYYIGCSKMSASILEKYWGLEPFFSNVEGDLYKFNVPLNRDNFDPLYKSIILDANIKVVGKNEDPVEIPNFVNSSSDTKQGESGVKSSGVNAKTNSKQKSTSTKAKTKKTKTNTKAKTKKDK